MSLSLLLLGFIVAVIASTVTIIIRGVAAGKKAEAETQQLRLTRKSAGAIVGLKIRPLAPEDRTQWNSLWSSYCTFYGEELPDDTTETTWSRLMDPGSSVKGWVAFEPSGQLVAFAHTVLHPHTWSPKTLCYLEDLFVAQPFRGRDVGHALITFLWAKAEEEGWGRLYWHTETTNTAARRLYDRFRPADNYVRYTLKL